MALICAMVWTARDPRSSAATRTVSPFRLRNKLAAAGALLATLASALCFHLDSDQLGMILGIVAAIGWHEAVRPINPSSELHKVLVGEGSALP